MRRWLALLLLLCATAAEATIWFVDPATGSDTANNCTAVGTPCKTIPGTRNAANTAFLQTTWANGVITTTAKVPCGDEFRLKCASAFTYTAAVGGAWRIDPSYYVSSCAAGSPIIIQCATNAQWTGSSGHFNVNGAVGALIVNTDPSFGPSGPCLSGGFCGLIDLNGVQNVSVRGLSASQRIRLLGVNTAGGGGQAGVVFRGGSGNAVEWMEITNKDDGDGIPEITDGDVGAAIEFGATTSSYANQVYIHDWLGPGIDTGMSAIANVEDVLVYNALIQNTGPAFGTGGANFTNDSTSFAAARFNNAAPGGGGVWCINCEVADGYWNGANSGGCNTRNVDGVVRYYNFTSRRQGRTADTSSTRSGLESGGDSALCGGSGNALPEQSIWVFRSTFYNNFNANMIAPHGAGSNHTFNSLFFRPNAANLNWDTCAALMEMYGNIIDTGAVPRLVWTIGNCGDATTGNRFALVSNSNIYRGASATGTFSLWGTYCSPDGGVSFPGLRACRHRSQCLGTETCRLRDERNFCPPTCKTFSNLPGFIGLNDRVGTGNFFGPLYTSTAGNCDPTTGGTFDTLNYNDCNFTPPSDTAAQVDAGVFPLLTSGSGTGVSVIPVVTSTPEPEQVGAGATLLNWSPAVRPHISDPRMYFTPANTWRIIPSETNIGQLALGTCSPNDLGDARRFKIATATATSLDIAPYTCTFSAGVGIAWSFEGNLPDAGGRERTGAFVATTTSTTSTTSSTSSTVSGVTSSTTTTTSFTTTSTSTSTSTTSTVSTTVTTLPPGADERFDGHIEFRGQIEWR